VSGLIGFLVVIALCAAVYFLGRSLFVHLRKVPDSFDTPETGDTGPGQQEKS